VDSLRFNKKFLILENTHHNTVEIYFLNFEDSTCTNRFLIKRVYAKFYAKVIIFLILPGIMDEGDDNK